MDSLYIVSTWLLNATGIEFIASYANYIVALYVVYNLSLTARNNIPRVIEYFVNHVKNYLMLCRNVYGKFVKIYIKLNELVKDDIEKDIEKDNEVEFPTYKSPSATDIPQVVVQPHVPSVIKNPNQLTPIGTVSGTGVDASSMYQTVDDLEQNFWDKIKKANSNLQRGENDISLHPYDVYGPDGFMYDGEEYNKLMVNPYINFDNNPWRQPTRQIPSCDIREDPCFNDFTNPMELRDLTNLMSNTNMDSASKLHDERVKQLDTEKEKARPIEINFATDGGDTRRTKYDGSNNHFNTTSLFNSNSKMMNISQNYGTTKPLYIKIEEDNDTEEEDNNMKMHMRSAQELPHVRPYLPKNKDNINLQSDSVRPSEINFALDGGDSRPFSNSAKSVSEQIKAFESSDIYLDYLKSTTK